MKIGLIGPNTISESAVVERRKVLSEIAHQLAAGGHEIVLTPDKDSLLEYFGKEYLGHGGAKVWLVIPTDEPDHADYLNTSLGDVVSCGSWDRQADEFNRQCDIFVCVGYAWGALKEIACAQYFRTKRVLIIEECISGRLPEELNFLVEYISMKDLELALAE